MPLINMAGGSNMIAEPRIDQLIARDSEVTAAVNSHVAASDPHTQYLNNTRGDARYRLASATIPESAIDPLIARDAEVTAAINAHVGAANPHPSYLLSSSLWSAWLTPNLARNWIWQYSAALFLARSQGSFSISVTANIWASLGGSASITQGATSIYVSPTPQLIIGVRSSDSLPYLGRINFRDGQVTFSVTGTFSLNFDLICPLTIISEG